MNTVSIGNSGLTKDEVIAVARGQASITIAADALAAMLMELVPTTIAHVAKVDDAATVAIWLLPRSS